MIEYAILAWDDATRAYSVSEVRKMGARLRTHETVRVPSRLVTERRTLTFHDAENNRTAEAAVDVTFELPAVVDTGEIKRGPDGGLMARPIIDVDAPAPYPWQAVEGPYYTITEDEVLRSWRVTDCAVDAVRAARAKEITAEARARADAVGGPADFAMAARAGDPDGIIDRAIAIREAADAALASLANTTTAEAAFSHPVEWPE
ncbi:MAG: hypothetical protein AB7P02_29420 [Alphaproteobacteria bacterium]